MINVRQIKTKKGTATGMNVKIPGSEHDDMLIILADKGFIMCGYLNIQAAERMNDAAVLIGAKELEDMLTNKVRALTPKAQELGITLKMTGEEALDLLMD